MNYNLALAPLASLAIGTAVSAQSIAFTGNVNQDFPAATFYADPGGMDVVLPPSLAGALSGWDMVGVAASYDAVSDTLFVGFDTGGITGDADGDGDPSSAGAALLGDGGDDLPDLGGGEAAAFSLDLSNDGIPDVIAGIPAGADITGFTVALFQGTLADPATAFGADLPVNVGSVFISPSAARPDLEFTIVNFSQLLESFAGIGQTHIGIHAFLGSTADAGIGEEFVPGPALLSVPVENFPCLPVANSYQLLSMSPVAGGFQIRTSYGLKDGYGSCAMIAFSQDPVGSVLDSLPGAPLLNVGLPDGSDLAVVDLGLPVAAGTQAVACNVAVWFLSDQVPSGQTYFAQTIAYPGPTAQGVEWFTSNVISVVAP